MKKSQTSWREVQYVYKISEREIKYVCLIFKGKEKKRVWIRLTSEASDFDIFQKQAKDHLLAKLNFFFEGKMKYVSPDS